MLPLMTEESRLRAFMPWCLLMLLMLLMHAASLCAAEGASAQRSLQARSIHARPLMITTAILRGAARIANAITAPRRERDLALSSILFPLTV